MVPTRLALAALLVGLLAGCPKHYAKPSHEPTTDELIQHLADARGAVHSFKTDSTMDYWIGKDRFRGTVLVMGELGAKVRMNALRPDDAVAADLACDGADFTYVDELNNCVLTGPCNQQSIAALLRVPLSPDDFLYLALGATPMIDGAQGKVSWDSKHGRWKLEVTGSGGMSQTVEVDDRDGKGTWDLLHSEVRGADGKAVWTVDHEDYREVDGRRVPGKSHVTTPAEKSDLLVDWGSDRHVNVDLSPASFQLEPPPVATCGQKP
jgi:hypothetical protein